MLRFDVESMDFKVSKTVSGNNKVHIFFSVFIVSHGTRNVEHKSINDWVSYLSPYLRI